MPAGTRLVVTLMWVLTSSLATAAGAIESVSPIDLAKIETRKSFLEEIEWCRTSRSAARAEIAGGACRWRRLTEKELQPGFQRDAIWLRLRLSNSSSRTLERWIMMGSPRISLIQLHYRGPNGDWITQSTGLDVPPSTREPVLRYANLLSVRVAPGGESEAWMRLSSESRMNLEATFWEPIAFRAEQRFADMRQSIGLGGLLLGVVFALFAYAVSSQGAFLAFAMGLAGEAILGTARSAYFPRYFWPEDLAFPAAFWTIGGLLSTVGFAGYVYGLVPQLREWRRWDLLIRALLIGIVAFQLFAIFIDIPIGTIVWSTLSMPLGAMLALVCFRSWRLGEQASLWGFVAIALLLVIAAMRVPPIASGIPESLVDTWLSPAVGLLVTVVLMLSVVEKVSVIQRKLQVSQAEAASQVAFLARMSHELRTPLDTILGNAQLLLRAPRAGIVANETAKAEIGDILQSGRHLLGLVDEILDYARGVSGALRLAPEPLTVSGFMGSVEAGARVLAARQRNTLEIRDLSVPRLGKDLTLMIDAGRLRQVIDNLIANAARHTQDGLIRFDYRLQRLDGLRWRLDVEVSDTGEGIAAEDQARIFSPFERAGRAARYGGKGAGMGLSIARQLIGLMGGEISVESAAGSGATFRFFIVVEAAAQANVVHRTDQGRLLDVIGYEGRRRTALVVDDDTGSRAILGGVLQRVGFDVLESQSGSEAVTLISSLTGQIDIVITDQFMPDGDGWLVLEGIARHRPGTPCMLVSAAPPAAPEDVSRSLRFAAVFIKPLDHGRFLYAVGEALSLRWLREETEVTAADPRLLDRPESAELGELATMIELGEITAIGDWARRLRHRMPDFTDFADQVEIAAADLDFKTLSALAMPEGR